MASRDRVDPRRGVLPIALEFISSGNLPLRLVEISVTEEQQPAAEPAIVQALMRATPAEQQLLLHWSRGLGAIRLRDLSAGKKLAAMVSLTRERKATWPLLKLIGRAVRHILWDARSWKARLGVGAVIATFVAVGNAGAGIVILGGGIGLPLWVLMAVGGVVVGLLIDAIKQQLTKRKIA
jgi:hypothetical protein